MELIRLKKSDDINKLSFEKSKVVATIGEFDGVHLAHQKLILKTKDLAKQKHLKSAVVTLYPHPDYVLNSREYEGYLTEFEEKVKIFESYNIDYLIVLEFSIDLMNKTKEEFYDNYLSSFSCLVVGYDFRFGYKGLGDASYLKDKMGKDRVFVVEEVKFDSVNKISSNMIRAFLKEGKVEDANKLLGYPYSFYGKVEKGSRIGSAIGWPTANVELSSEKFTPKCGVYSAKVIINDESYNGILNIGTNPSINTLTKPRLEVHIFDFNEDIYGLDIKIEIHHFIREEIKFSSKEELACQIEKDRKYCINLLGEKNNGK